MLDALDSPRHARLVEVTMALLRAGAVTPAGATPGVHAAPDLLRKHWRRFNRVARQLGPDSPDDDYHDARIRAKRIRYATEFTSGLYGDASADFVAALKQVQTELGRRQDAVITIELLERVAAGEPLPNATVLRWSGSPIVSARWLTRSARRSRGRIGGCGASGVASTRGWSATPPTASRGPRRAAPRRRLRAGARRGRRASTWSYRAA